MSPVELPYVPILLDETFTKVLWDTGAEKSFISEETYHKYFCISKKIEIDLSKTKLEEKQKRELQDLFDSFQGLFLNKPGLTHVLYHEIDTGDNQLVVSRPYRYDRVKQEILDLHVDKMLKEGPIIPIQSPYASPVVLCRKNNGLHTPPDDPEASRFAVDYRKLNAITKYPRTQGNRTERVNRDLVQMIANYVTEQHDTWDQFLREFAYAIRTTVNETTGKSPAELFLGRKLIKSFQKLVMVSDGTEFAVGDIKRLFEEARQNTETKQEKWKKYYNRCRRDGQVKENVIWKAGKRLTINADQIRIYRHRKYDETEIGTGNSDNGSLHDESSGFDRVQRISNGSRDGKKKRSEVKRELVEKGSRNNQAVKHTNKTNKRGPLIRSIPSSWSEKGKMIKKSKHERLGYKESNESKSGGPERKVQKGSEHRVNKRNLSSNDSNSVLPRLRKKNRRERTVTPSTSGYNLRPRKRKREESRLTMERKTQQGGPVRSRKGRERNDCPYIEERTRSSNKNTRRGGDQ
ncbi:uncharacterized protein TNCV_1492131 [Trichonephila clavipes]|nr:uncharacterized protein TNCV_1492131 [Trichonephila clavipes]